jgi:hypothetical protein
MIPVRSAFGCAPTLPGLGFALCSAGFLGDAPARLTVRDGLMDFWNYQTFIAFLAEPGGFYLCPSSTVI